jgi:hypothetical protein
MTALQERMIARLISDCDWEEILKLPITTEFYPRYHRDNYRGTLLHIAVRYEAPLDVIKYLIHCGLSVDIRDSFGHIPMEYTTTGPRGLEKFEYLIQHASQETLRYYSNGKIAWKEILICLKYGCDDLGNGGPICVRIRCLLVLTQCVMIPRISVKSSFKLPIDLIRRLSEYLA